MKKFLACLLVFVFVVAGIFAAPTAKAQEADGSAYIDIIATILEEAPRFELAVKSGATAAATPGTNDGIDAVAADSVHDINELSANVAAALAVDTDATVVFSINQIASARTNATYSLTIAVEDLELVKYSDGTTPTAALKDNEKFTVKSATLAVGQAGASIKGAVLTQVEMASVVANDTTDILTVDYHGVVAASAQAKKELGVYTVVWNHNADAVSGDYEATITLTVAAQ